MAPTTPAAPPRPPSRYASPPPGVWRSTPARRLLWALFQLDRKVNHDPLHEPDIRAGEGRLIDALAEPVRSFPWASWYAGIVRKHPELAPRAGRAKDDGGASGAMTGGSLASGGLLAPQQGIVTGGRRRGFARLPVEKHAGPGPTPLVVAVDFDGTLAEHAQYPAIGAPIPSGLRAIRAYRAAGYDLVLWSARPRAARPAIEAWLRREGALGLFSRVILGRKIRAAVYFDDHGVNPADVGDGAHPPLLGIAKAAAGLYVALWLAPAAAAALALPGGEDAGSLHATVIYSTAPLTPEQGDRAAQIASGWAAELAPRSLPLSGLMLFRAAERSPTDAGDRRDVLVARIDSPELRAARLALLARLRASGVPVEECFPEFRPHVTLAYLPASEQEPVGEPAVRDPAVSDLLVGVGAMVYRAPIGAPMPEAALVEKYSDDEARDDRGRWEAGGGSAQFTDRIGAQHEFVFKPGGHRIGSTPLHAIHVRPTGTSKDGWSGELRWMPGGTRTRPTVEFALVHPDHQRRGIATEMLRRARLVTPELIHSTPEHQTAAGRRWSAVVKAWAATDVPRGTLDEILKDDGDLPEDVLVEIEAVAERLAEQSRGKTEAQVMALRREAVANIVAQMRLDLPASAIDEAVGRSFDLVTGITDTTKQMLRDTLLDVFQQASDYAPGEGLPTGTQFDFARQIRQEWDGLTMDRARMIAVTEYNFAASGATLAAYRDAGVPEKRWFTVGDEAVCFPAGTTVATTNGGRAIETLVAGDEVMTPDGPRYVLAALARPYGGRLVVVGLSDGSTLAATEDHPFWRGSWVRAGDLRPGDRLHAPADERREVVGVIHIALGDPQDGPPARGQEGIAPRVVSPAVPVRAIDLQGDERVRQREVHGVAPDGRLLRVSVADLVERQPHLGLQRALAAVAAVARHGAEAGVGLRRLPECRAARPAGDDDRRAAAGLGAEARRPATLAAAEADPASLAGDIALAERGAPTCDGADLVPPSDGRLDREGLPAPWADAGDGGASHRVVAGLRAVPRGPALALELPAAAAADGGGRPSDPEGVAHVLRTIVAFVADGSVAVHNLTVVGHRYYAGGVLVHNCQECDDNASEDAIPIGQAFSSGDDAPPAHPNCRCALSSSFPAGDEVIASVDGGKTPGYSPQGSEIGPEQAESVTKIEAPTQPEWVDSRETLRAAAIERERPLVDAVRAAAAAAGGGLDSARVKHLGSVEAKLAERGGDPRRITDALGVRVILDDPRELPALIGALEDAGLEVAQEQNFWPAEWGGNTERPSGYRGANLLLRGDDGFLSELQVHTPETAMAQASTHAQYAAGEDAAVRPAFDGALAATRERLDAVDVAKYSEDQPRDERGRFAGSGAGGDLWHPAAQPAAAKRMEAFLAGKYGKLEGPDAIHNAHVAGWIGPSGALLKGDPDDQHQTSAGKALSHVGLDPYGHAPGSPHYEPATPRSIEEYDYAPSTAVYHGLVRVAAVGDELAFEVPRSMTHEQFGTIARIAEAYPSAPLHWDVTTATGHRGGNADASGTGLDSLEEATIRKAAEVAKYDDSEARDEAGRWTAAGANGAPFVDKRGVSHGFTYEQVRSPSGAVKEHVLTARPSDGRPPREFGQPGGPGAWNGATGSLRWSGRTIDSVNVHPDFRRGGLATEMLRRARIVTPGLTHDYANLTSMGQDWSAVAKAWMDSVEKYDDSQPRDDHGMWTSAGVTAAEISGVTPADAPLRTHTLYHVTRRENVASILARGFDINRVEPRWQNDKAISFSRGALTAARYFSRPGQPFDGKKYALLEAKVKGRILPAGADANLPRWATSPDDYTSQMVAAGYDGHHIGGGKQSFVYNPRAITSIREIAAPVAKYDDSEPRDERGRWSEATAAAYERAHTPPAQILPDEHKVWWHGSHDGGLGPDEAHAIHVGTRLAAKEALEARIGVPAKGEWDGTREYGRTPLAGQRTMRERGVGGTGYNAIHSVDGRMTPIPEHDYLPGDAPERATYGGGHPVPLDARPDVFPVRIVGPMTNGPWHDYRSSRGPYEDFKANGYMAASLKRGNPRSGFYYDNVSEDENSVSAVVPRPSHLARLDAPITKAYSPSEQRGPNGEWIGGGGVQSPDARDRNAAAADLSAADRRALRAIGYEVGVGGLKRPEYATFAPSNVLVARTLAGMPPEFAARFADAHVSRVADFPLQNAQGVGGVYHAEQLGQPGEITVGSGTEEDTRFGTAEQILRHELLHAWSYEDPAFAADAFAGYPAMREAFAADLPALRAIGNYQQSLGVLVDAEDYPHVWTQLAEYRIRGNVLPPRLAAYFAPLPTMPPVQIRRYSEDEPRDEAGKWTAATAAMVAAHGQKTVRQFLNTGDALHGGGQGASGYVMPDGSIAGGVGEHADLITTAGLEFPPARWQDGWPAVYHYDGEIGAHVPRGLAATAAQRATIDDLRLYAERMGQPFVLEKRAVRKYSEDEARDDRGRWTGGAGGSDGRRAIEAYVAARAARGEPAGIKRLPNPEDVYLQGRRTETGLSAFVTREGAVYANVLGGSHSQTLQAMGEWRDGLKENLANRQRLGLVEIGTTGASYGRMEAHGAEGYANFFAHPTDAQVAAVVRFGEAVERPPGHSADAIGDRFHWSAIAPGGAGTVEGDDARALARRYGAASDVAKYSDDQPRVPAGGPGGGEWTSEGALGPGGLPARALASRVPGAEAAANIAAEKRFIERELLGSDASKVMPNMTAEEKDRLFREWNARSVHNEQNRAAVKQGVEDAVAGRLVAEDPPFGASGAVHTAMSTWAETSADSDPRAVSVQLAAARVLGTPRESADGVYSRYMRSEGNVPGAQARAARFLEDETARNGPAHEAVVRAMYAHTQAELAAHGIREVTVYRGMMVPREGSPAFLGSGGEGTVMQQPLSSWTMDRSLATSFAKISHDLGQAGATRGVVLESTFPASRVVSTARTGFGALPEYEFVIAGGPANVRATVVWGGSLDAPIARSEGVEKYSDDEPRDERGRWAAWGQSALDGGERREFPESLGVRRADMPQVRRKDHADFLAYVRGHGVSVHETTAQVAELRPAQNEYHAGQAAQLPVEHLASPLIVSSDDRILDGTNRWVRMLHDDPGSTASVIRLGATAREALALMAAYPRVGSKDVSLVGPTIQKYSEDQPRDERGMWTDAGGSDPSGMADWSSWAKGWTADQRGAVEWYQAGGYGPINRTLRGTAGPDEAQQVADHGPEPVGHYVEQIDSAIAASAPLPRDATVYRRIYYDRQDPAATDRRFFAALGRPGIVFTDRGYASATSDRGLAKDWAATDKLVHPHARLLEIHVPAGARAPYIGPNGNHLFKGEREVLLPRGGTFTVRSVDGGISVLDYAAPKMAP